MSDPLPERLVPMLATAGPLPADQGAHSFEFKWDGIRVLARWDGDELQLTTRNRRDVTVSWPELEGLGAALGARTALLDGEIVALDETGVPRFQRLQERMHVADPRIARERSTRVPAAFLAFDVLHLDGRSTVALPWSERRALLEQMQLAGPAWSTTPTFPGQGDDTMATARARGLEGVMAKRMDSPYTPGVRSRAWVKTKLVRRDELVVGGWLPGEGGRSGRIGALLVGRPTADGGLALAGGVGTGFTEAELARLADELAPLVRDTSPFTEGTLPPARRGAVWVEPRLVVEVAYTERTTAGILRHPSYKGRRIDKSPEDVNTEPQ